MLITPASTQLKQHIETREGITAHFNVLMENILNENTHRDKYWILGKAKIEKKKGKEIVRPFLQACTEKPGIIKESFVYEVDNKRGVKTLLWIMHPGDMLSFPTLGKSIRVTGGNTGSTILLPR
jgi:hypothetical protein